MTLQNSAAINTLRVSHAITRLKVSAIKVLQKRMGDTSTEAFLTGVKQRKPSIIRIKHYNMLDIMELRELRYWSILKNQKKLKKKKTTAYFIGTPFA